MQLDHFAQVFGHAIGRHQVMVQFVDCQFVGARHVIAKVIFFSRKISIKKAAQKSWAAFVQNFMDY
ncbi:MAG: hypothetical protein ACPG6T_00910 [Paracoccaceae bacterium]